MSRCFPFPPPGYEKKPTTDDADLLKKEKHKEKKHKKDKKDKEKKEGKEKREKDRSDGKNREKKDRKEKHREKKKDKDKDKDKSSISEEKRVGGQLEGYNGEKVHPKEELDKEKKSSSDEKKAAIQSFDQQGEKPVQSSILVKETEDPKFVQELGRRIRDDEKGAGSSQLVERFNVLERKKDDPAGRSAVGDIGVVSEGKNKDRKTDNRKMDGQRIRDESSFGGSTVVENRAGMAQNKLEGPTLPSDKKTDKKIEEKNKSHRENDDKRGDKRKKKDGEKKSREKEKKKEEKAKEKNEHKRTEKSKTKHSSKGGIVSAPNDKSTHLSKDGAGTAASEGNLKKRKAVETNGFSYDDEPRPNKMPRPASNVSTQNGRKLEPSQSPGLFPLDRQRQMASPNNLKVDNKEHKINGMIAAPPLSVPKPKPSSSTASPNIKPFPVSVNKPLSSTVVSVSTAKPSSATANELSAPVTSVSILKPPNVTANEIAAPFMPVSTARPPPSASPNETATSVTSIPATKQPSPVLPSDIAPKKASVSSRKPSSATNNQVVKASMKPPHPDSKFLNQILTVPKMEEVPDLDDQEWLFSSKDRLLKKPDMASVGVPEEPQVWAEALRLESVDIFALPYVVPY